DKALHVKGFLRRFRRTAARALDVLAGAAETGMPLVGIDPAVTLTYRDEYRRALPGRMRVEVQLLQEWLSRELESIRGNLAERRSTAHKTAYHLMGHCTERTAEPGSQA